MEIATAIATAKLSFFVTTHLHQRRAQILDRRHSRAPARRVPELQLSASLRQARALVRGRSVGGRPREAKNLAAVLEEALAETVAIVENGRRRKITKRCAMIKQLVNKARLRRSTCESPVDRPRIPFES